MSPTHPLGRVAALLVKDGAVALVERQLPDELYYLFPGGAVEAGETPEAAVVREVHEELGLVVTVDRLVAEVAHRGQVQYYYAVTISGGTFGAGAISPPRPSHRCSPGCPGDAGGVPVAACRPPTAR